MPATITVRVNTGSSAGTQSGAQTGIDFISADNATNTLGNRQAHPVVAGTNSYEKWLTWRCDVAPATQCGSFLFWGPGSVVTGLTVKAGVTVTGATPTASTSSTATTDVATLTSSGAAMSVSGTLVNIGDVTEFLVLQAQTTGSIAPGPITQQTYNYQYTES